METSVSELSAEQVKQLEIMTHTGKPRGVIEVIEFLSVIYGRGEAVKITFKERSSHVDRWYEELQMLRKKRSAELQEDYWGKVKGMPDSLETAVKSNGEGVEGKLDFYEMSPEKIIKAHLSGEEVPQHVLNNAYAMYFIQTRNPELRGEFITPQMTDAIIAAGKKAYNQDSNKNK